MRQVTKPIVLTAVILALSATLAEVRARDTDLGDLYLAGEQHDWMRPAPHNRAQGDTVWFGGDDGNGYAVEGGVWDFEGEGGAGDLQGWISIDRTEDADDYFGRVSAGDFSDDPCDPMMNLPDSQWQIWCGLHETQADELDYLTGIGYGDNFCQSAFSPIFPAGDVSIDFSYFNDTEVDWDYTFLYVLCLDSEGELLPDGEIELDRLTGDIGSPASPATWSGGISEATLPAGTDRVRFEIRFDSDGAWSDEDGLYDCLCGPFAADNITIDVTGSPIHYAEFEDDADGYSFSRCEGVGTFMGLVHETTYTEWLDSVSMTCYCPLSGWAIEFNDEENSPYLYPGHASGQREIAVSGIVDRGEYVSPDFNETLVFWDEFVYLLNSYGTFYRFGYTFYPHTTEVNPEPHWGWGSVNAGYYTSGEPGCGLNGTNLTHPDVSGDPLPGSWELMRFTYQVYCSCEAFGIPSSICTEEGNTTGSPVIDNVRVALASAPDAPGIANLFAGGWFHDGYGQTTPTYLSPVDVGNSNPTVDLSDTNDPDDPCNDWHADTTGVAGPTVTTEDGRWLVELCFRLTSKGPMQDLIPRYLEWKARLPGEPEEGFVCALMDSVETVHGVWPHKFLTYFHEDDPGFDWAHGDLSNAQEILPDSIWTPGTSIEYYYRSYWYDGGAPASEYYLYPLIPSEFEILPRMRRIPGADFEIQWPSVLYVDAYNRGAEYYVEPMLELIGVEHDKFDYLDASSNWHAPLARSHGGTTYNPGGYGNNGLTVEQALGYRLILVDVGSFGLGAMEANDFPLFNDWIHATECGAVSNRRGLIFSGDGIASALVDHEPHGPALLTDVFGATLTDESFYWYSGVEDYCVTLAPSAGGAYEPALPLTLSGNGCPVTRDFDVLGLSGVEGAVGNLDYSDGGSAWNFASVVRDQIIEGESNWRTAIQGFGLSHLAYEGCQGSTCSSDSVCVVTAGADFLGATLGWMTEGAEPFGLWAWECGPADVDDNTHLTGPATHLYAARPNPFHRCAAIRFSLATDAHVQLRIYDVTGRQVRDLLDAELQGGQEHRVTWEGTNDAGRPVGTGIFWMQLTTDHGFESSKRMIVMR